MDKFLDWMYKYGWIVQTVIATLTLISVEMSDYLLILLSELSTTY